MVWITRDANGTITVFNENPTWDRFIGEWQCTEKGDYECIEKEWFIKLLISKIPDWDGSPVELTEQ